jgi:hypothetical protein
MSRRKIVAGLLVVALMGFAAAAKAEVSRSGKVQVKVDGNLAPQRLPRQGTTPIAVSFAGHISTTDASQPPRLETLQIDLNRFGRIDSRGLRVCRASEINTASSARALSTCRSSLVGRGKFWADVFLAGEEPHPVVGRLLLFNGREGGRSMLLGHIYSDLPFATSFVIPFALRSISHGRYGVQMSARLPKSMSSWGDVTGIEMKLSRQYSYRGVSHSFLSAGCPAAQGFPGATFVLARASFGFADATEVSAKLIRSCRVRR